MTSSGEPSTRERLLEAAITLFASKGYAATSVADIQRACGLAAGSGALYKHFASKRQLLEEATRRYLDRMVEDRKRFDAETPRDVEEALAWAVDLIWDGIKDNGLLLRVLLREPETFPELTEEVWSTITANAYQRFAQGLQAAVDHGVWKIADPEATAAVLVASLAYYPIMRLLGGHTPGDVDEGRFRDAWIQHTAAVLAQSATRKPDA